MTYNEMIAVLQAANEGKTIQRRPKLSTKEYEDIKYSWNFDIFDYRVKPEPTIRPYANADEFLKDMKEHGPYIKEGMAYCLPVHVSDEHVYDADEGFNYEQLLKEIVWQDGHHCGIEE